MKLKTQNGRTLELNRNFRLNIWTMNSVSENALIKPETEPVKVAVPFSMRLSITRAPYHP